MKRTEAEEEAEKNIPYFQLEKDRIRCAEVSKLHVVIPYAKRLVRLLPHIRPNFYNPRTYTEFINTKLCIM